MAGKCDNCIIGAVRAHSGNTVRQARAKGGANLQHAVGNTAQQSTATYYTKIVRKLNVTNANTKHVTANGSTGFLDSSVERLFVGQVPTRQNHINETIIHTMHHPKERVIYK